MSIFLTLTVLVCTFICCIGEWFPLDIVAILVAVILMVLGLVTPEEGISGFANPATITVMAMFILSAGIARTGAIQQLRDFLLRWGGRHPKRQIFALGVIAGPVTAFVNNTAVVAVFLPIVEEWCDKLGISVSKLLIPLSYATILGGMITLVGTSTNVLASGLSEQLGYGTFGLFEFTKLGIVTFSIGLAYLAFVAPVLLPNRRQPNSNLVAQDYCLKDYISEIVISPCSDLVGEPLSSKCLQARQSEQNLTNQTLDVDVLELVRDGVHFSYPWNERTLQSGDILIVRCSREDLLQIKQERCIEILPEVKFDGFPSQQSSDKTISMAEVLIPSSSGLIGSTLHDLRFRQRYNATVLAIRRGEELARDRISDMPLHFGDVLLVQGPQQSLLGLQTSRELLVIRHHEIDITRREHAWIAISIGLGVVGLTAFNILPILVSALLGAVLMVLTGCLKPGELYGAVRWNIIFLLAGLIPLGIAMQKSGATHWIAQGLLHVGQGFSGYWLLTFFFVVTAIVTEMLSNNASVVLMLPVAAEVAEGLNFNPFAFMLVVTFAASSSFMTPIGYQTNTMVYGPGGYRFLDFFRVGMPLSLLMAVVTPALIMLFYGV